jgi:oligopeptidase B
MHRIALTVVGVAWASSALATTPQPPVADKHPYVTVTHGDTLRDDYRWLREKTSPDVLHYLEAENAYCDAMMAPTLAFQETLYKEMLARIQETDVEVPYRRGGYYYYTRTEEGKQYAFRCRKKGSLDAPEEVTLDLNAMAVGHDFLSVDEYAVSDDGNLLAFSTDSTGFRQYSLSVKDLRTGQILPDHAERVTAIAWAADNKTLFYAQEDPETKRWYRIYRHVLGTDQHELLYEEKDEQYDTWVFRTRSGAYLGIGSSSSTTSEMWVIPAAKPMDAMKSIAGRREGHEYYFDHAGDHFLIRTNDKGRNFRLVSAPVASPGEANWKEVVAHRDDVMLEDVDAFAGCTVLTEREAGVPQLRVIDAKSGQSHRVEFPEPVYVVELSDNYEFDTPTLRFTYESLVTPESVFDYDVTTRTRKLQKQMPVLGGFDAMQYHSERIYATASDGTKIPISLVYRGSEHPRNRPLLLLGYGSYGVSSEPYFQSNRLSMLDRGVVYGIAHIRGGGELGKKWHDDGKLMNKKNTFTDFITCCEYLIAQGYTSKDQLAVTGRSAGGLLMGAVVTMRPDLFKVVFTAVPFVDVMNTMLDPTLPLTTQEYLEWGDPNQKAAYDYMRSYSPYDQTTRKAYPIMLVRTSLNDSQVMYWEPAKWVAKLRANKTDTRLLLLKTRMDPGGHGGASGRYDRLRDVAFEYAFVMWNLGIKK